MSLLLRLIPAWVPAAILLMAAIAGQVLLMQRNSARTDAAVARQVLAQERAASAEAARHQEADYRAKETAWSNALQEAFRALETERQRAARFAADLRAARLDADSLRGDIARFASGGGPADDSLAACRDRAEALGLLAGEALRSSEACAADGEAESAKLRAVLSAWPR